KGSSFSYQIPVSNGSYTLKLHFAECSYTGPGQRLFNVNVNGASYLSNFDIFAAAGATNTAVVKSKSLNVTGGWVRLDFATAKTGINALVQGVEVVPA